MLEALQTPRFCGQDCRIGEFDLLVTFSLPLRINWLIVGIEEKHLLNYYGS